MTTEPAPASTGALRDLFGRGMVFVLVWSMQLVVGTIVSPVLAHTLAPAEFGRLAAAIALYQLLMVLAVFGLDQALEMQRVEDRQATAARGLLATGIGLGTAVVALAWATSGWWAPALGFPPGSALVAITLLWTAPGAAVLLMLSLLQAEDRLAAFTTVSLFSTVGGLVFGLILLFTVQRTAVAYAWGGVAGQGIAFVCGYLWTRPRWRGIWQPPVIRRAFALGAPLVLSGLSHFFLTAADRFLIQRMLGSVPVARYQIAFTVGNALILVLLFTNRAWIPRLKSITAAGRRWVAIATARDGILRLVSWALLGIAVSAPVLLRIVAPPAYGPDELMPVVLVVAIGALPLVTGTASLQLLITERQSRALAIAAGIAVGAKVVFSVLALPVLAVPGWGLVAVGAGTTLAVWAQSAFLRWVRRGLGHHARTPAYLRTRVFVTAAITAAVLSLWLPTSTPWLWGRFTFSVVCLLPFWWCWRALLRSTPGSA